MILEYKLRTSAKPPTRANPSDAGLDVYYCPKDPNISVSTLKPGENQLLATGLTFGVPHGYMLQVCNRSSIGAKRSLAEASNLYEEEISMSNRKDGSLGSTNVEKRNKEYVNKEYVNKKYVSTADLDMRDRHPKKNDSISKLVREGWKPNGF